MIAKQTVFLTEDRKTAVVDGDPKAKFLLVREGHEIPDAQVNQYEGAADLINSASKTKTKEPAPIPLPTLKEHPPTPAEKAPAKSVDKKPAKKTPKKSAKK